MKKESEIQYFIFNLANNRYYASWPDGFSLDILDAESFDTEAEAKARVNEIMSKGLCLTIIKGFVTPQS